jgi:hypothetical protein
LKANKGLSDERRLKRKGRCVGSYRANFGNLIRLAGAAWP